MAARRLTHVNERGEARMVDVSAKRATDRRATARGKLLLSKLRPPNRSLRVLH